MTKVYTYFKEAKHIPEQHSFRYDSVLAHLSGRLRMSYYDHLPHWSTPMNNFSKIPGSIFFKLHVEPSAKQGLKICTNGYGHYAHYGKNTKKASSPEPRKL